jgi:polyvinyl alcohol dehydrogenase (cytochrome)
MRRTFLSRHIVRVAVGFSLALAALFAGVGVGTSGASRSSSPGSPSLSHVGPGRATIAVGVGVDDWPTYGHDPQHTFHGLTTLTKRTVRTLRVAWKFPTGDAVTATPTVVNRTVYVGSWDGYFYALAFGSGALRWKFKLDPQPAVVPVPGQPRPSDSDGGLVTSSAWFEPAGPGHPPLVIFGGGFTLYALVAHTGQLFWKYEYTGRPDLPPDPVHDGTRIFSSPVVADGKVFFGVSVDGALGHRGYIAAADLVTGTPAWEYQTDTDGSGNVPNDGCGNVWSSGSLVPGSGAVVFDTSDCESSNKPPLSESILSLSTTDGHLLWSMKPQRVDPGCDYDFGATVNIGLDNSGMATFLGVGGKDGTYYSLDPATGALRWSTNVVFGGQAGGFIGTAAYDGSHVVGSTALGDFGGPLCDSANPRDQSFQEPTAHSFDPAAGGVLWQRAGVPSFAPTTLSGGMAFNGLALAREVVVRDVGSGKILANVTVPAPCWSGIATVGDALFLGTGTSYVGSGVGVMAFTPGGAAPRR